MWEITLLTDYYDIFYIQELQDNLNSNKISNCVAINYDKELICCSIAISNDKDIEFSQDLIFECILKIVKSEYFKMNLNIFGNDRSFNSFMLSSLVLMDLKEEIEFAKFNALDFKKIHVRSFVYFKLHKLLDIWERVINYINIQFGNHLEESMYLEFLKFLADNTASQIDLLYLDQNTDEIVLKDSNQQVLCKTNKNDEIGMIVNVIIYAPKKLVIKCLDSLSNRVSSLLNYIFEDRIGLLL